jgi:hypothetical protein
MERLKRVLIALCAALCWTQAALALTPAQLATLKTAILAEPSLSTAVATADDQAIANWFNEPSSPAVAVWKPVVDIQALNSAIAWADMVVLTQEKQLTYQSMIWANQVDMTDNQVRQGLKAVFGAASTSYTAIVAIGQRTATRYEALFSSGAGPKVSTVFGEALTPQAVSTALRG